MSFVFFLDEAKGLKVVVTGASTGIGEQIAYKFASLGANILVTARTVAKLQKVVRKLAVFTVIKLSRLSTWKQEFDYEP